MKKPALLLLALSLTCLFTASCQKTDVLDENPGTAISKIEYPVTIGEYKIPMDEYAYYFFRTKKSIEQYRDEPWEKESSQEELKAETLGYLTRQYTIRKLARDYGYSLDQEDDKRISGDIRALEEEKGGREAFGAYLEEEHLTEELLRHIMGGDILEEKLMEGLYDDESPGQNTERLNATWFRTQHIMVEVGEKYDEGERREYAQGIYERAAKGEDFTKLAAEYNEDPDPAEEYLFTLDEKKLSYEDRVAELEPGQISEVFWSFGNLYIVKRLPLTEGQIAEKSDEVRRGGSYEAFGDLFDAARRELEVEFDPMYGVIDVDSMALYW